MKILLLTAAISFILFLIPISLADEYNLSCIFTPKIQLVDIILDTYGADDYYPYLVENNEAYYSVKLITVGNWSQYQYNIHHRTIVQCDDDKRTTGVSFRINTYQLPNGTVMSDFIDEGRFYVPEDRKHCHIILTKIYATNQSWESESGCEYGINNCLCFVNGLSGSSGSSSKEVLTKEQFFAKKAIMTSKEIAEEQSQRDLRNIGIGAIISLASVFVTYKLTEKRFKKERFLKACEDVHASMVDCFYKINETANIQPKTLKEYKSKVGTAQEKFENSLNVNSIFFDKVLSDALDNVRLAFRQASRAIFMNLPRRI